MLKDTSGKLIPIPTEMLVHSNVTKTVKSRDFGRNFSFYLV